MASKEAMQSLFIEDLPCYEHSRQIYSPDQFPVNETSVLWNPFNFETLK